MPNALKSKADANPYLRDALQAVPDYPRAVALRANLLERQQRFAAVHTPALPADADADLDAWLADVTKAAETQRTLDVQRDALDAALRDIDRRIENVPQLHTDTLLKSLARDLAALMAAIDNAVAQLDGARTPAEAITRGVEDAYRELPALRESYDLLRAAQMTVVLAADPFHVQAARSAHIDDPMASDLVLANMDAVLPGWRLPDKRNHITINGAMPDRRPWPLDPIEQLVWLSTSNAEVWLPTLAELDALRERRQAHVNPQPKQPQPKPKQASKYPVLNRSITALAAPTS